MTLRLRSGQAPGVDLHLHTTASDGRLSPHDLVTRVAAAGVSVMAVTDHDTTAAIGDVRNAARAHGIEAIAGIEVTAVEDGADVHVLGYFMDESDAALTVFLAAQRARRIDRAHAIADRLASLGVPVDVAPIVMAARQQSGRSVGRPQIARAMIEAGHVADIAEAFTRWLGRDGPAFVPREGPTIVEVIAVLHAAGGVASIAHPGKSDVDHRLEALREAGLDAIEVYHPDHDEETRAHYAGVAARLGLLMTGGSDFHGDPAQGREPGMPVLPVDAWHRLHAASRHG